MIQERREAVEGLFFWDGEFQEGRYIPAEDKLEHASIKRESDLFIPFPINAHTHIGDSFIQAEPKGSLMDIVGPGGFKHRNLKTASEKEIIESMNLYMRFMRENYISTFFDFRETGLSGINTIRAIRKEFPEALVLARPPKASEIDQLQGIIQGIGFSSINDHDYEYIIECTLKMRSIGGIIATHFSESVQEDMEILREVDPDLLIHCTALGKDDLDDLSGICKDIAVTPRSNLFYGIKPDYGAFLEVDLNLMLGTDNVMTVEPDMFSEMECLYRYQKNLNYIKPETIMQVGIENPRLFLGKVGKKIKNDKWIWFQGKRPTPFQIVTKFKSVSEKIAVQFLPEQKLA